jgi:cation-transporting ATPase E
MKNIKKAVKINVNDANELIEAPILTSKAKLTSIDSGLSSAEVNSRKEKGLLNIIDSKTSKTIKEIITGNLFTIFNAINLAIAIWLVSIGSFRNITFLSVIFLNIVIGIIQEINAKKTIEKLSLISAPVVDVFRDGLILQISSEQVVIDDLISLTLGKQVIADCVIAKGEVEVNESLLTGESDAITKGPGEILYSGSFIVSGDCLAQVTKVGKDNYIQKLVAQAKKYRKPNSEIMRSISYLIRYLTIIVVLMGTTLFIYHFLIEGMNYADSVVATSGAIIGMIPSGLVLLTSVSLAYGVITLGKNNTLVQDLYCIEMLARVDTLCLDKTGTITDGTMKVKDVFEYENQTGLSVKQIVSVIQGVFKENNPTALALQKRFGKSSKTDPSGIIPFSSARKFSAVSFKDIKSTFIIGAPEFIFKDRYKELQADVEKYASLGYRVILLAHSEEIIPKSMLLDETKLRPLALIAIEDTIRKDAFETISYFKQSGVDVKVISGDNPLTVSKIAKRVGINNADNYISLSGKTDEEIEGLAYRYSVFGRVNPTQKRKLIQIFKANKSVVAMTGDGVNDILALKEADISIAMANGSEAVRSIAHLVLLDSNFSSMPKVVKEGRRVVNNIQRVAALYLTKTLFSILISVLVLTLRTQYPIQTIQLFFYDFLVIGVPALYLAVEPNNNQIKGKFLINIIASALPGGLLVVLNYAVIVLIGRQLNLGFAEVSTTTVLMTTYVGMLVLYRIVKPFNFGRTILFASMVTIFIIAILTISEFFYFVPLNTANLLLIVVIAQYSLFVLPSFAFVSTKLRDLVYRI